MPIPDFQALMLPILQLTADLQEHRSKDVIEHLAAHFRLNDAERRESLPSGAQPIIDNRTNWAITSSFTRDALEYIPRNETKIVLIDGERLAQYMIDYNLGVTPQTVYELKRIDFDYFGEE